MSIRTVVNENVIELCMKPSVVRCVVFVRIQYIVKNKMAARLALNAVQVLYIIGMQQFIMEEFRDMPASFGPDLPMEGLRGFLVAGEPADGCGPLASPPDVVNSTKTWIVLIARYNCSFEMKVRNAQAAGYACAIVHNVNSSDLETMSAKNSDGIDIPSVFVSDLAGLILSKEYLYTSGFYIMVNGDLPFNINTHLLLPFAIVVVLCLLVILIFMIVKCIKDRRRARRHRLPHRSLAKIPTCKFSKGDPYDTCAICLDDYQDGDKLRVLPCAHAYHAACIDPWLTQNKRVCPVCKRRVLAAGERRRTHTDSDSDTEPLLPPPHHAPPTQGGTFEEQRENPFTRAARFMARLRSRPEADNAEAPTPPDEYEQVTENNEENTSSADTAPLVGVVADATERRARRPRRARTRTTPATPRPALAPALAPAHASINDHDQPHIGVAALPASDASPDHVDL